MLRGFRRIIVIALCLIGTGSIVSHLLQLRHVLDGHRSETVAPAPKPDYVQSFPSPDGKYRADLLTWAGGGGLAPYCNEALVVVPASGGASVPAIESRREVYSGQCSTFADHERSPKIVWAGDHDLHVSISIDGTVAFPATIKLAKTDASGAVRVRFDARE